MHENLSSSKSNRQNSDYRNNQNDQNNSVDLSQKNQNLNTQNNSKKEVPSLSQDSGLQMKVFLINSPLSLQLFLFFQKMTFFQINQHIKKGAKQEAVHIFKKNSKGTISKGQKFNTSHGICLAV